MLRELEERSHSLRHCLLNFRRGRKEELLPWIGPVERTVSKVLVQLRFERHSVLSEVKSVHIERKRHRGAAELAHTVERIQPPRQANLDDTSSECASVGDDVYVASANIGGTEVVIGDRLVDLRKTTLQLRVLTASLAQRSKRVLQVRPLFIQTLGWFTNRTFAPAWMSTDV